MNDTTPDRDDDEGTDAEPADDVAPGADADAQAAALREIGGPGAADGAAIAAAVEALLAAADQLA